MAVWVFVNQRHDEVRIEHLEGNSRDQRRASEYRRGKSEAIPLWTMLESGCWSLDAGLRIHLHLHRTEIVENPFNGENGEGFLWGG